MSISSNFAQLTGALLLSAPTTGAENKATTTHPQTTCYILHAQTIFDGSPQFDVSFLGQIPKIVATRGEILSLKFTKYRLAAWLRPDPIEKHKNKKKIKISVFSKFFAISGCDAHLE